jgi:hypothetical protein
MNSINMPGFTAEASLYKRSGRYESVATQSHNGGGERVIAQLRVGGGGTTGFWGCALCVSACTIILGPEAALECLIACKDSGACDFRRIPSLQI